MPRAKLKDVPKDVLKGELKAMPRAKLKGEPKDVPRLQWSWQEK